LAPPVECVRPAQDACKREPEPAAKLPAIASYTELKAEPLKAPAWKPLKAAPPVPVIEKV